MNRSLRHRLLLSTVVGAGLVLIVTGFCIYWFTARSLRQEFDESLIAKTRALSTLVEDESGRIEFESDLHIMPEFRPGADAEYLELRTAGGREIVYRSPSLGDQRLTWPGSLGASAHLADVVLPDGRAGRSVALRFHPRSESQPALATSSEARLVAEVMLSKGTQRLQGQLTYLALLLLIAIAIALLGLFAILSRSVKYSLRPLESLAAQIEKINVNDLSTSFTVRGSVTELVSVTTTLNELFARLKAAFDREKGLTADVAHELRTPLSGLRATVDLALRRERTPAEYQQMLIRT